MAYKNGLFYQVKVLRHGSQFAHTPYLFDDGRRPDIIPFVALYIHIRSRFGNERVLVCRCVCVWVRPGALCAYGICGTGQMMGTTRTNGYSGLSWLEGHFWLDPSVCRYAC